jgi:hypothetical protein
MNGNINYTLQEDHSLYGSSRNSFASTGIRLDNDDDIFVTK